MIINHDHFDLGDKIVLQHVTFVPPMKGDSSMHDEACFFHVIKGRSTLYYPEGKSEIKASDNLLLKCGSYVNSWKPNPDQQPSEVVFIHFFPDLLKQIFGDELQEIIKVHQPVSKPAYHVPVDGLLDSYVESLLFYFQNPALVNDQLIRLKVKEIILLLLQTQNAPSLKHVLGQLFNPAQHALRSIIDQHAFEDLTLDDLAVLTGMSLSSFKRKFHELFDQSPKQYIIGKRLERAKWLLRNTNQNISEIAYDCGFNDAGHFSKTFSATYGVTPSQFKASALV